MASKLIFPYALNSSQQIRKIEQYTKFGFISQGKDLIDLSLGNCGCFPLGFKRQDIIDKVAAQMSEMPFCSGEFFTTNDAVLELSERLFEMSGGYRSVFALSGSDAVEGAIRLAQLYHLQKGNNRNKFLGFKKSYHGSTYLSSSISDATYMTDFFGKDERCVLSDYNLDDINSDLCAVVIETASWQNGLKDPGEEFWRSLRLRCSELDVVLIVDDIAMCGGKTGTFFGFTDIVRPDIFTMGKALSGGYFPLSATMVEHKIFDVIKDQVFCHGFTYSFSLSGIYSTLAYLDVIEREGIFQNYRYIEETSNNLFARLQNAGLIKSFNHHGLVYNLNLLSEKPVDTTFEQLLFNFGLNAGMWNEGGSGLLITIPLNADLDYIKQLESRLTEALINYRTLVTGSN
jgi:taurine-pyruvate aminotransferase